MIFKVKGVRTDRGCRVTYNDVPLRLYLEYCNHSPTGFEWGYGGSGPSQLAFCILLQFLLVKNGLAVSVDDISDVLQTVRENYHAFRNRFISPISTDVFIIHGDDIATFLEVRKYV